MRYRDANAAIEWLCKAFGFEKHLVVPGENGTVAHAQLAFGNGMIMLGSAREDEFGQWVKPPRETGGIGTQSVYVIVEDADAHYSRAKAAGAEIVMEVKDQDYGGRLYSCRSSVRNVHSAMLRMFPTAQSRPRSSLQASPNSVKKWNPPR